MKLFNQVFAATALSLAAILSNGHSAHAHEIKTGNLVIHHPWIRQPIGTTSMAAGYTTIDNTGNEDDTLLKVTIEKVSTVQIHEMKMQGDVMKMGELPNGILIPAHQSVSLKPKMDHLMLLGIKSGLMEGEQLQGTFNFAKAGIVKVDFEVVKPNTDMSDMKMK